MKTIFTRRAKSADSTKGPLTRREVIGAPVLDQRERAEPRPSEVDVTPDGSKMSVVIVDDLTALEKHIAAWEELAAAAVEPNVFYEPWMLMPALRAYGGAGRLLFALVQTPDPARPLGPPLLCGFFPLELKDHYDSISKRLPLKTLCLWRKPERSEEHTSELQSRPQLVCRL